MTPQQKYNSYLVCYKPVANPRLRLIAFPYAGGSASVFRPWATQLPPDVELCAIQLPGREYRFREALIARFTQLIAELVTAFRPIQNAPYLFFGHSLGGITAYELTQALVDGGLRPPEHLFVSGCRAPHFPSGLRHLCGLSDQLFADALKEIGGTPAHVFDNPELLSILLPIIRADFSLLATFHHQERQPYAMPITGFCGLDDPEVVEAEMMAWKAYTTATFELQLLPGDHFFIRENSDLIVQEILAAAQKIHPLPIS